MHLGVPIVLAPLSTVNNLIRRNDKSEVKYSDLNFFSCGSARQKGAAKKAMCMQLWQNAASGQPPARRQNQSKSVARWGTTARSGRRRLKSLQFIN